MSRIVHQISFFAPEERILASSGDAEVRYVPEVLGPDESAELFARLREAIPWEQSTMWMYDREVTVPRLTAWYGVGEPAPPDVDALRTRMCERFGAPFNAVGLNLYRDARDSVAWHSDKNEHLIANPSIAVLSLGAPREMQIRPRVIPSVGAQHRSRGTPRHTLGVALEPGSVLLMTGNAQDRYEHCIPKLTAQVDERISVVFRTKVDEPAKGGVQ